MWNQSARAAKADFQSKGSVTVFAAARRMKETKFLSASMSLDSESTLSSFDCLFYASRRPESLSRFVAIGRNFTKAFVLSFVSDSHETLFK